MEYGSGTGREWMGAREQQNPSSTFIEKGGRNSIITKLSNIKHCSIFQGQQTLEKPFS